MSSEKLHLAGRLFDVDYRDQAKIPRHSGRFTAACETYLYMLPESDDFLPLAIKTNEGSDLIYTPADDPTDWLLAKILSGANDIWYTPWYHFASTHYLVEVPYEAAMRYLSDEHLVLAVYKRSTYCAIVSINHRSYRTIDFFYQLL